jgi:hypothetical protein
LVPQIRRSYVIIIDEVQKIEINLRPPQSEKSTKRKEVIDEQKTQKHNNTEKQNSRLRQTHAKFWPSRTDSTRSDSLVVFSPFVESL